MKPAKGPKRRFGEMLTDVGVLTIEQLNQALALQQKKGGLLGAILVDQDMVTEDLLLAFLSRHMGVPMADLLDVSDISKEARETIPEATARRLNILPLTREGQMLTIVMTDPLNVNVLDDLKAMTSCEIKPMLASAKQIRAAIRRVYDKPEKPPEAVNEPPVQEIPPPTAAEEKMTMEDLLEKMESDGVSVETVADKVTGADMINLTNEAGTAPIIKIVNFIIYNAIVAKASDIHVEVFRVATRIRYRMDGVMHIQPTPPRRYHNAIISRIKIMAQLDIAERRLPQDGRIKVRLNEREVVLRVSIIPTSYGEKAVMRILETGSLKADLTKVGFESDTLQAFKKQIYAPHGIILVTGPTGSGKSTTLYSALTILNKTDTNIMTIEDPVEYALEGVNQVQAHADIGLTFAAGLRSFLRQDPDIILVGEVRDTETAEIAIKAALTGHLVFSTLHTNDAPSTVTRLINMGIEPYLTASTVNMVLAQRLVRVICKACAQPVPMEAEKLRSYGIYLNALTGGMNSETFNLSHGVGCTECSNTGYRGRIGIMELLLISDPIRELILKEAPEKQIKAQARLEGMRTLREAAVSKMLAGVTTLEEVQRVTQADED